MGFRFRRTINLGKGLRVNLSKSGLSLSAGRRGATFNIGSRGTTATVGIPGSGLSYRSHSGAGRSTTVGAHGPPSTSVGRGMLGCTGAILAVVGLLLLLAQILVAGSAILGLGACLALIAGVLTGRAKEQEARQQAEWHRDLTTRFGSDIASRIVAGELWLGQTEDQLLEALGAPYAVDDKVLKTKTRQVWKYDPAGTNRFKTRVTVDNGFVTGWDKK